MKESSKTSIFLVVALFLSLLAYLLQPKSINDSPQSVIGQTLFKEFDDPLAIKSLEIAKIDPLTGDLTKFQVADTGGSWTIPSHENYPADAKDQMARVASALQFEVLSVASEEGTSGQSTKTTKAVKETAGADASVLSLHSLYGVVDPTDRESVGQGETGIKITCLGAEEKELAQLIIGKEVEGAKDLRYIRIPGQYPVYTAKISDSQMSTKFEDWIEKNLLRIDTFEMKSVTINDYTIEISLAEGAMLKEDRSSFDLAYDDRAPVGQRWKLESMKLNRGTEDLMEMPLSDSEQLNEETLTTMVNALDDLKIVDVRRKPDFLAEPLRENSKFPELRVSISDPGWRTLAGRGFYVYGKPPVPYSNNGEIMVEMKNGVRYILRFGSPAGMGVVSESEEGSEEKKNDSSIALNRYLFIMCEFDETLVEKPTLQPLPEVPEEGEEEELTRLRNEREVAEQLNARAQDEYDTKIEEGKKAAAELNRRFGDWFYIISEDVYKKIRIGHEQIVKKKEQGDAAEIIDLDPSYGGFPELDGEEFPEINILDAPTLPGQEGAYVLPDLNDEDEEEVVVEDEEQTDSE